MANKDMIYFNTYISNFEENFVTSSNFSNFDSLKISGIKIYLNNICYLNKRLKMLNEKLKSTNISNDWVENAKLSKILMIRLKFLLKQLKSNKLEVNHNQMIKRNNVRKRIVKKTKRIKLYKIYLHSKKEYFDDKISIWMKEHQNEILKEKEKKKLKKDADIILTDIRTKHSSAKKSLFILQELNFYRKLKVDISRISRNLIPNEVNYVIRNIFTKLIQQWKTLSREYCIEEKGLKLMMETDNVDKALKHTKNVFNDWETNLFKSNLSVARELKENNYFITLRVLWDNFLENIKGTEIPIGWIVPCSIRSNSWMKYMK